MWALCGYYSLSGSIAVLWRTPSGAAAMNTFSPINQLELKLADAKLGRITSNEFVRQLWLSDIALPTATEVFSDGSGFTPVLFDKNGTTMLAAFTAKERIGQLVDIAKFCMVMKGSDLLLRMPKGFGLVVNPGLELGFEVSPSGIREIVGEYS
jgi:hypothetical protein